MNGELTLARMGEWLAQADQLASSGRLDLSGVTRADGAGAAFLLELTRRAQRQGLMLELVNPSRQLQGLLEFLQLDGVLKLTRP